MKIKIQWQLVGRVYINDKFSHNSVVNIDELMRISGASFSNEDSTGLMLGVYEEKTIHGIIQEVQEEAKRIVDNACENLKALRIKKKNIHSQIQLQAGGSNENSKVM